MLLGSTRSISLVSSGVERALMPVFFAASAAACPDPSARDEVDALNSGDLYTANTYPVLAGGGQDLSNCLDRQGYVALAGAAR